MQLTLTNILLLLAPLTTALPTSSLSQRNSDPNTNPILTTRACPRVFPASTPRLNLLNYPDISVTTTLFDSSLVANPTGPGLPVNVFAVDGPAAGALVGTVRFATSTPKTNEERSSPSTRSPAASG
ncbi:hypothetical protein NEMBOFW57_005995 [Staphylotrichum longicolle]|uniref:Uncharacterized protein n=1 Tax=Staphylotrichum longicolle TaxID=669026 RepID=A0AAD4I258_9PEZI|nr:hypothetical protein NEMBOFW57_005995 [Staphylotrichum longicolle]